MYSIYAIQKSTDPHWILFGDMEDKAEAQRTANKLKMHLGAHAVMIHADIHEETIPVPKAEPLVSKDNIPRSQLKADIVYAIRAKGELYLGNELSQHILDQIVITINQELKRL